MTRATEAPRAHARVAALRLARRRRRACPVPSSRTSPPPSSSAIACMRGHGRRPRRGRSARLDELRRGRPGGTDGPERRARRAAASPSVGRPRAPPVLRRGLPRRSPGHAARDVRVTVDFDAHGRKQLLLSPRPPGAPAVKPAARPRPPTCSSPRGRTSRAGAPRRHVASSSAAASRPTCGSPIAASRPSTAASSRRRPGWKVVDLDSRNGTYVNDALVKQRLLEDGDRIRVGRTRFEFHESAEDRALLQARSSGLVDGGTHERYGAERRAARGAALRRGGGGATASRAPSPQSEEVEAHDAVCRPSSPR